MILSNFVKKILTISLFFVLSFFAFSKNSFDQIFTTLVVMEEMENNGFVKEDTPVTNGVFDALWEKDFIFFDMKINKPISIKTHKLSAEKFINIAKNSGADSILLIKFHYNAKKTKGGIILTSKKVFYHLFSINSMTTLKSGTVDVDLNKVVYKNEKKKYLRNVGYQFTKDLFNE